MSRSYTLILRFLGTKIFLLIIGGLIGYFFSTLLILPGERAKMRREIVQVQYHNLKKLKLLAELGSDIRTVIYMTEYVIKGEKEPFATDKIGIPLNVPFIIYDSSAFAEWKSLAEQLGEVRDEMEPELARIFNDILSYVDQHPIPISKDRITIEKSKWSDKEILGRWFSLNQYLKEKVEKFLSLE